MSSSEVNPEFEALLDYIKRNRGLDFTGYKRSTLIRRVKKRLQALDIDSYSSYMDFLEVEPQEYSHLFDTILINVTSFFRDRPTWDYIAGEILPRILARKEPNEPLRFWSAGCASGEEAYTLAMLVAEALGVEQFNRRVKIYATDLDEEAINYARHATYNAKSIAVIPPELLEQYFEKLNGNYTFRKDLRRSVIFGRNNLLQDAPISRIDLLACRNTLMYFNADSQAKILARFQFALRDSGFLFLGKAEMLIRHSSSFTPVDLKRRIFMRVAAINDRDRFLSFGQSGYEENNYFTTHVRIRDAALAASPVPQVVVDLNGFLVLVNERARLVFNLTAQSLSRPLQDLEFSYRPVELRSCIDQAYADHRVISIRDVEWASLSSSEIQYFDVQVAPLYDFNGNLLGASISFIDVTRLRRLQQELEHSNQELEMAYEELQSSNEELETTNEELQSSNEELETTNEELQSINEEMETMNEELQSSNEELQTVNEELRLRSEQLNEVNAFLETILISMGGAVVVLDRELNVQVWTPKAEDLWGIRADEAQTQHFLNLDIGLPVEQLTQPIRICLLGQSESLHLTVEAINRRGKRIQCKITCTPLLGSGQETRGVILVMEEQEDGKSHKVD